MVYDMPQRAEAPLRKQKRQRGMDRAAATSTRSTPPGSSRRPGRHVFLDDELRYLNDDQGDPANIFPDQIVFLDQMRQHGHDKGLLMIPGSAADFTGTELDTLTHPVEDRLRRSSRRQGRLHRGIRPADEAGVLDAEKATWAPAEGEPLLEPLRALFEPIMAQTDLISDGIGYPVGLEMGAETVVLDFPKRIVREPIEDEEVPLRVPRSPPNSCAPFCATTSRTG